MNASKRNKALAGFIAASLLIGGCSTNPKHQPASQHSAAVLQEFSSEANAIALSSAGKISFYSPASLWMTCEMIEAAEDSTKEIESLAEIEDSLRSIADIKHKSSLWFASADEILPGTERLEKETSAELFTKNFTRKDLSDWANKMIGENLFTSNDNDQPLLKAAADVLYLNSTWEMPFDPDLTEERTFFSRQKRQKSFMNGEFEIPYLKSEQAEFVSLPLKNSCRISMVIPYGDWTIDKIFENDDLRASLFESAQTLDEQNLWSVSLSIPKMEFYATLDTDQTERIASQAG